ncbi:Ig-like domain-containing protein [Marinobacter sp. GN3S48]|uniref:Ig-like domain-containing protein n=1 Tax=Marinobacter sp. GN3S48 TaxID=3382302 RepID=UPI00387B27D4
MALNTGNTIANAALGQELLHVHLVGTAMVEDGALNIEAVGVIEPDVMGVDVASGLISFRLESYRNPDDAPPEASFVDNEAPTIKSWVPGEDNQDKMRPGDPVIVYFSEPVLPGSVTADSVTLYKDGVEQTISHSLNGSVLVVTPASPLSHGAGYSLLLNGITDLTGHELATPQLEFALPSALADTSTTQSPVPLTTRPGYPCAKIGGDPLNGNQGRCDGGKSSDDLLPVTEHSHSSPIVVRFSQNMDKASISEKTVLLETFQEGQWQLVSSSNYTLETQDRLLEIIPVAGWKENQLYRYTLSSNQNGTGEIIRSESGLPLQTRILSQSFRDFEERTFGGPNLVNYFVAVADEKKVFTPLRNLPSHDHDGDLRISSPESGVEADNNGEYHSPANAAMLAVKPGTVSSDLVTNANIGCEVGQLCQDSSFIYKTAMLDVDVGEQVDNEGRVPVSIHPSKLYTTGVDFWVAIDDSPQPICIWTCSAADLVGGVDQRIPTGPMVMRIRYAGPDRKAPVPGFIYSDPETNQLRFQTELDVYMDAPYLYPDIDLTTLDHNMRSFPIDGIKLDGPITFLKDGRMQIALSNTEPLDLNIEITGNVLGGLGDIFVGSPDTDLVLTIPEDELVLNYISPYTEN